jgi:uncharacterized integral membrane protein (TIGR00697 family)
MNNQRKLILLACLSMIYVMILLASAVCTSKLIVLDSHITLAGALVVPISFALSDIIAEIYNYKTALQVVFIAYVCQLLFALITFSLMQLPSPHFWQGASDYHFVLGPVFRISIASFAAYFLASFVNVYILTKWKALWNGKLFWLRSFGSSTIGEFLFTAMAVILIKYGRLSWPILFDVMITSYTIKVVGSIICSGPANGIVLLAKRYLNNGHNKSTQAPFNVTEK